MFGTHRSTLFFILVTVGFFSMGSSCDGDASLMDGSNSRFDSPSSRGLAGLNEDDRGTQSGEARQSVGGGENSEGSEGTEARGSEGSAGCATACGSSESCVEGVCVPEGALRVVLVWDTAIDLDLYVKTPHNETIYYRNREGDHGGRFLKDGCLEAACEDTGPFIETVIWRDAHPRGTYEIWAKNFDGGASADFRIEVSQDGEILETFRGSVGSQQGASSGVHAVCVGEDASDRSCSSRQPEENVDGCLAELDRLGISWEPWGYSTQSAGGKQCTVDDPIRVDGVVNGIEYRYYNQSSASSLSMACPLALALHEKGEVLKRHNIAAALHIGTFNCRTISGSTRLSNHSHGTAIDIWGYVGNDGTRYVLEEDWEHDTDSPSNAKARLLYDIAHEMHAAQTWNHILTPNYNTAHDNHFHLDLASGSGNFLGYVAEEHYIGSDRRELCPGH